MLIVSWLYLPVQKLFLSNYGKASEYGLFLAQNTQTNSKPWFRIVNNKILFPQSTDNSLFINCSYVILCSRSISFHGYKQPKLPSRNASNTFQNQSAPQNFLSRYDFRFFECYIDLLRASFCYGRRFFYERFHIGACTSKEIAVLRPRETYTSADRLLYSLGKRRLFAFHYLTGAHMMGFFLLGFVDFSVFFHLISDENGPMATVLLLCVRVC